MKTFFIFFLSATYTLAQTGVLDKKISIKISNERLDDALKMLSKSGGFSFSYNPAHIEADRKISVDVQNRSIQQILDHIFKGSMTYKEHKNYLILQKKEDSPKKNSATSVYINGYILDEDTGEKISQVSVFERQTLASTTSNYYGYYKIKLPVNKASNRLEIRKENYFAKTIVINGRSNIDINLKPQKKEKVEAEIIEPIKTDTLVIIPPKTAKTDTVKIVKPDTISLKPTIVLDTIVQEKSPQAAKKQTFENLKRSVIDAFVSAKNSIHLRNISDTLYRPIQISFLPFIGTNHVMSGNVINILSYNIVAGYSLGVNGFEVGGVLNLVRKDVNGLQFAGMGNIVGQDVAGLQFAGTFNAVIRDFSGIQTAGAVNVVLGQSKGWQIAGAMNVANNMKGTQMAGAMNVANNMKGTQMAGAVNFNLGKQRGWQIAPFNVSNKIIRGHQLGVFNYADSSATTPIGFVSFVRKNGYRRLEISSDELNYANLYFKTGTHRFYNIFAVGYNFSIANKPNLSFGYGMGTALRFGKTWGLNLDWVGNALTNSYNFDKNTLSQHSRLSSSLEKKITPAIALSVGVASNTLVGNLNLDTSRSISYSTRQLTNGQTVQSWIGLQASLRICNIM